MRYVRYFLKRYKYEILLVALIQHLFIGIVLTNLNSYTKFIWPLNMVILGIASVGVFIESGRWKKVLRNLLFIVVLVLPIALPFAHDFPTFMIVVSMAYVIFFVFIFWEVLQYLISPGYINSDIISASACGYFLIIEICCFLMQVFFYRNPDSFEGINITSSAAIFMDFVYFSSISLTSIGFGDITPTRYYTKLLTSFFGLAGQFYSVVLVGILISKFSARQNSQT
ncbi:MAG: potassium channel family protein [Ginsengibacter sp.]